LFLDEIGNLPLAGQVKLLRVLETGRFERLGSNKERQVKVRVISATNADLAAMIRAGTFREDLYYRLNLIELKLPPLAERPGDILPLAEHFLGGEKQLGEASRAASRARMERQRRREELQRQYDLCGIVFDSEAMSRAVELACRVGRADVPVLITGPNGAGKDRIAQIVHANSMVRDKAFVAVNCGALPSELVEAELFGAEAGAYTGANKAREGRFELADGGTLFLDEIGTLPLPGQVKLLRVLESGEFERLGSGRTRKVKVRVISATNADLKAMIRAGTFREDLYYRLNVIEVNVPPLAERPDDILPLAAHFIAGRANLGDAAREALLSYAWPGNVRELKNAIERASLLAGENGTILPSQLNLPQHEIASAGTRNLDEPSQEAVEAALRGANGVISRAAQALGLSRQALYRRMERYGIPTAG
jgi:transcriptional regulator with PAS, ATPase and Fis domain